MPTLVKDGSGGDKLTGELRERRELELCAPSADFSASDEATEVVIALVKNDLVDDESTPEKTVGSVSKDEHDPPSDDNIDCSSTPPTVVGKSPSKKMLKKNAHEPTAKNILTSGNYSYSKRTAKENVSPQKGTSAVTSIARLDRCTKAIVPVSASGGGSEDDNEDDNSSCILLNDAKDTCGNIITVVGKVGTEGIGAVFRGGLSNVINMSTLKEGGGESFGVRTRAKTKLIQQKTPSSGAAGSSTSEELNQVKSALNKHTSAVLTLLRQAAPMGETCVPESLLNPVREETMIALQNAISKAENEAVLLYNEEIASMKMMTKKEKQRLETTLNGGGTENERYGTKSVLASANSAFPATSKRALSGNENEDEPVKKKSKSQRKICSSEGCTNEVINGGVCKKHGAKKKQCNIEGCANGVIQGGVCWRHGAKDKVKRCSSDGCTNYIVKGGVCWRHGAKDTGKRCS